MAIAFKNIYDWICMFTVMWLILFVTIIVAVIKAFLKIKGEVGNWYSRREMGSEMT